MTRMLGLSARPGSEQNIKNSKQTVRIVRSIKSLVWCFTHDYPCLQQSQRSGTAVHQPRIDPVRNDGMRSMSDPVTELPLSRRVMPDPSVRV